MKIFHKENWFVFVGILFLLGAFGSWPYDYYQLLRWVVCAVGAYSAYLSYKADRIGWAWLLGIIAVLFNPISPPSFHRNTWQILDFSAAASFLIFVFSKIKFKSDKILPNVLGGVPFYVYWFCSVIALTILMAGFSFLNSPATSLNDFVTTVEVVFMIMIPFGAVSAALISKWRSARRN